MSSHGDESLRPVARRVQRRKEIGEMRWKTAEPGWAFDRVDGHAAQRLKKVRNDDAQLVDIDRLRVVE